MNMESAQFIENQIPTPEETLNPDANALVDAMTNSCVEVFLNKNDNNLSGVDKAAVYDHYIDGVKAVTGLPDEVATTLAQDRIEGILSSLPIDQIACTPQQLRALSDPEELPPSLHTKAA